MFTFCNYDLKTKLAVWKFWTFSQRLDIDDEFHTDADILKKLYGSFFGWGSTASRLQCHYDEERGTTITGAPKDNVIK